MRLLSLAPRALTAGLFLSVTIAPLLASQGPGTGPGTAGSATQFATAIVIYGGVTLIFATSLVVAIKRRFLKR